MENLLALSYAIMLAAFIINVGIALYGVFIKPSVLKKIMAIIIFSDSINILAIALGFRVTLNAYPSPPILTKIPESPDEISKFVSVSVDPLPQAFVITAVVIGLSIVMLLLSLAIRYYEQYKSIYLITEPEKDEEII
ncbi:MAG: cation:proton antiporter subunit C [Desulfurococcaceae archaeon]